MGKPFSYNILKSKGPERCSTIVYTLWWSRVWNYEPIRMKDNWVRGSIRRLCFSTPQQQYTINEQSTQWPSWSPSSPSPPSYKSRWYDNTRVDNWSVNNWLPWYAEASFMFTMLRIKKLQIIMDFIESYDWLFLIPRFALSTWRRFGAASENVDMNQSSSIVPSATSFISMPFGNGLASNRASGKLTLILCYLRSVTIWSKTN